MPRRYCCNPKLYPDGCRADAHRVEKGIWHYPGRTKCFRAFVDRGGYKASEGFTTLEAARNFRNRETASIVNDGRLTTDTTGKHFLNRTVGDVIQDRLNKLQRKDLIDYTSAIVSDKEYKPREEHVSQ